MFSFQKLIQYDNLGFITEYALEAAKYIEFKKIEQVSVSMKKSWNNCSNVIYVLQKQESWYD